MTESIRVPVSARLVIGGLVFAGLAAFAPLSWGQGPAQQAPRAGDYIIAVVNQELVTAAEVQARMEKAREEAARGKLTLPPPGALRQQIVDALIDERVQITNARETGPRIDEVELDRAVASVAQQNQVTLPVLRERLRKDGIDYARFRADIRDQMQVERVREREVVSRIKISEADIDAYLEQRKAAGGAVELNVGQILVKVPDGASDAVVAERRVRAERALARVRTGEDFGKVAREISDDANKEKGGEIGLLPTERLPEVFLNAVTPLQPGAVSPQLLRTGAGFHVLKLIDRREAGSTVQQTHARHILLRTSNEVSPEIAVARMNTLRREITSGKKTFEQAARDNSEDGSAANGGDLNWTPPGAFVAEFEDAMNALPVGGISEPVTTRFGVHLIQVLERRDVAVDARTRREQARNALREQKFEAAYTEWLRDLRGRAYVELREPPQ